MAEKVQGTVKWFSNKKGYGFVTPAEGSSITEDIFVHQSSIFCEGYRTLDEGWEVEFEIGHDDDGKVKAVSVTAPGGGPCFGPRKSRPNPRRRDGKSSRSSARGPPKPMDPFWHESLNDSVKGLLAEKSIRTSTGTIDVSVGASRVKLGTNGYSSMAHSDGVLAEGSFTFDNDGNATFTWEHFITYDKGSAQWVPTGDRSMLPSSFCLADANVLPVGADETAQTLWGDLPDPKSALEENGFQMRHVVLTPRRRR
mmetsp:Transcript_54443/g.115635  ORF Transcript_54443/g.115635 Transcript_54443/m.115635 type:complete len:254 (-) Transcript_54443:334-1095(-)|eukprot:CAMPEP_0172553420 /NCGR_PEP_ID=MMETSP1067-20121228/50772_1 /TAXON_ID=265564 ORGANISM="Thalassiosira punctigera, Strain Tpunct2005C2" /NCGR_SAMPLE_ID=MMETSP1067 /ASSEMBLY_ACC=CAM_ASM_000444 /LENGTH=253 /DNA_ID=CAMNT_0013341609 /DNA_START=66 /DNA_END=827 /DNA_ORIENTATION=-